MHSRPFPWRVTFISVWSEFSMVKIQMRINTKLPTALDKVNTLLFVGNQRRPAVFDDGNDSLQQPTSILRAFDYRSVVHDSMLNDIYTWCYLQISFHGTSCVHLALCPVFDQYTGDCGSRGHLEDRFCLHDGVGSRSSPGFVFRPC